MMLVLTLILQVYIVSGGGTTGSNYLASTETLEKDEGSAWQVVANMPEARSVVKGVGLDHGRFMITGECWTKLCHYNNNSCRWPHWLLLYRRGAPVQLCGLRVDHSGPSCHSPIPPRHESGARQHCGLLPLRIYWNCIGGGIVLTII